jgi:hypothetical protein
VTTRDELEAAVRRLLPKAEAQSGEHDEQGVAAASGIGGALAGFLWGYWRGRRQKKSS